MMTNAALTIGIPQGMESRRNSRRLCRKRRLLRRLRLCRWLIAFYAPWVLLPLLAAFWLFGDSMWRALGDGLLGLGLYNVGLFRLFAREADVLHLLRRRKPPLTASPV